MFLCSLAQVSRSGYYDWLGRLESKRSRQNRSLLVLIKSSYHESHETYGAIRVHRDIHNQGAECGKNRVARLMKESGLKSIHRQKYKPQTTQSKVNDLVSPNVISQDFTAKAENQKWGCDISYIETGEGWLYLAIVMDFFSRKIIGFHMGPSLEADLCCRALHKAFALRLPPGELIHHSDRGTQYASLPYRQLLQKHGVIQSMSRKCHDGELFFIHGK